MSPRSTVATWQTAFELVVLVACFNLLCKGKITIMVWVAKGKPTSGIRLSAKAMDSRYGLLPDVGLIVSFRKALGTIMPHSWMNHMFK